MIDYGYQHAAHAIDWRLWHALKFYKDVVIYGPTYILSNSFWVPVPDIFDIETEQREGWTYDLI